MERILTALAIANVEMAARDYISGLKRLGVVVKMGAQRILLAMPDSRGLSKQVQVVEARCTLEDGGVTALVDVAEVLSQEFGCGVIAQHLVPVACIEILQLWQARRDFKHVIMFHQPVEVNGMPSLLYFQRIDDEIVLGHTDALGKWNAPETLFAACMPVVTPVRKLEQIEEVPQVEELSAMLA